MMNTIIMLMAMTMLMLELAAESVVKIEQNKIKKPKNKEEKFEQFYELVNMIVFSIASLNFL